MREALRSLTTRGRAFVAAGVTAALCAVALGQADLLRIAGLLVALPFAATWFTARRRYQLTLRRQVAPDRVTVGQEATVHLELTNSGRGQSGLVLLEEQVPFALGGRPRFLVEGMAAGATAAVAYRLRPELRGRYELGPLRVRVDDPFGMLELTRTFHRVERLTVVPAVEPLPPLGVLGGSSGSGDQRSRAFAVGSAEDVTVRDYRRGDDLRRVHWRSSARVGELMVRREEQPWESRATVLLDNRACAHRGGGPASSFEVAVRAAASIGAHLAETGHAIGLLTSAASTAHGDVAVHDRGRAGDTRALLDSLAVVDLVEQDRWEAAAFDEASQGGLLIAVLGSVREADHRILGRIRHHAGSALAVVLDAPAWERGPGTGPGADEVAGWLAAQGWRTATLGPRDRLPDAWRVLGTALTRSSPSRGGVLR